MIHLKGHSRSLVLFDRHVSLPIGNVFILHSCTDTKKLALLQCTHVSILYHFRDAESCSFQS